MERPSRNVNLLLIWWWDRMNNEIYKWRNDYLVLSEKWEPTILLKYLWSQKSRSTWVWLILLHVSLDPILVAIGFYPQNYCEKTQGSWPLRSIYLIIIFFKVSGADCMSKMQLLEVGLWKGYKSTLNLKCIKKQLLECVVLENDTNR